MTTLRLKSTNVSLPTGSQFELGQAESPKSVKAEIFRLEVNTFQALPIPNTTSIDDLVKEFEADPEMASAIAFSRQNLSKTIYDDKPLTLSAMRLSAGLSQDKLASLASTSQSHIANIESGKNDPSTEVISKLAKALNSDPSLVFTAILNQRQMRENQL